MYYISIPLSPDEIARLAKNETDPARKEQLLQQLTGEVTNIITIDSVNIPSKEIARISYTLVSVKAGTSIGEENKVTSLSPQEIAQVFDLIKTFSSLNQT